MTFEHQILKLIINKFGRRIVVAFYLVAYHLYLFIYLRLWEYAIEYNIREYIHSLGEMLYRYGRIENGIFLIRKGIKIATHTLQLVYDGCRSVSLSALECNMLAEMSQALVARLLVASTSLYLISAICYLRGVRQMDYP